jgi:TetR/AcrR family transcriptional repressor of lmrAB and yxaGH operons
MARLSREVFVERTRDLLNQQAGADVSLSTVLGACGANKGSLYHFFPDGKDELVLAAIESQASLAISMNQKLVAESTSTSEAVLGLLDILAKEMDASNYSLCMPFSAVGAIAGGASEELRVACMEALSKLEALFAKGLRRDGLRTKASRTLASLIISTIEGALLQSRARKSSEPLRNAAGYLGDFIQTQVP